MIDIVVHSSENADIEIAASIRPKDGNYVQMTHDDVVIKIYCGSPESSVVLGRALCDALVGSDALTGERRPPLEPTMYGDFIRAHENELLLVERSQARVKPQSD